MSALTLKARFCNRCSAMWSHFIFFHPIHFYLVDHAVAVRKCLLGHDRGNWMLWGILICKNQENTMEKTNLFLLEAPRMPLVWLTHLLEQRMHIPGVHSRYFFLTGERVDGSQFPFMLRNSPLKASLVANCVPQRQKQSLLRKGENTTSAKGWSMLFGVTWKSCFH